MTPPVERASEIPQERSDEEARSVFRGKQPVPQPADLHKSDGTIPHQLIPHHSHITNKKVLHHQGIGL
ncbi:hypothetical protein N783_04265 [Pontibacillus marinus BH030004 = DSM 16465]|uniref:Uncharacterized protein n=1 Tax=Pontibacillus marinus BH030004 = DSM 16465 TaxID=1385511 RepID=A0A0A5I1T8_9BACI|nr:hypothetical protein N783_04265 [Pontibacillus marinus BH030004 = DSM 16465]